MKLNNLFLSVGICGTLLIGCNQPQKQSATTNNDDVIWKANISYCLTNDKPDWSSLRDDGSVVDYGDMYNFKISEEKGKLHDLMKLFYDSAMSKTYTIYSADPVNGMFPGFTLLQKEKQIMFPDTVWNHEHTKIYSIGNFFQYVKGLNLNHELMFDSKVGTIKSNITDVDIEITGPFEQGYMVCNAVLKLSDRTIDSMGTDQPGLKPEITWGREILMQLIDSGQGPASSIPEHWAKMDSLSRYTVNGVSTTSTPLYPICIKTTFNKSLAEWILIASRKGQLPAFSYVGDDKIGEQIPQKDLKDLGTVIDTFPDENGVKKGYPHRLGADDITGVELKEEIVFHKSTFAFESKISYAGILVVSKDKTTGKPIHHTSTVLFWVKLN